MPVVRPTLCSSSWVVCVACTSTSTGASAERAAPSSANLSKVVARSSCVQGYHHDENNHHSLLPPLTVTTYYHQTTTHYYSYTPPTHAGSTTTTNTAFAAPPVPTTPLH